MSAREYRPLAPVFIAGALTGPWLAVRITGTSIGLAPSVLLSGTSILGAAFLLAWAAETAEKDVSRSFAIAVLAVLAVAPEYAIDALYAWEAGVAPASPASREAADLAVANMTGANRILIGIGWSGIVLFTIYRAASRSDPHVEHVDGILAGRVHLDRELSLEIMFLFVATLYAFFIPLTGSIAFHDMLVLVGLYVLYILFAIRTPPTEEIHVGVPAYLQSFGAVADHPDRLSDGERVTRIAVSSAVCFACVSSAVMGIFCSCRNNRTAEAVVILFSCRSRVP